MASSHDSLRVRGYLAKWESAMKFRNASPVLFVKNPEASVEFYRDRLGFEWDEKYGEPTFFAIAGRGSCRIMLRFTRDGMGVRPWVPDTDEPLFDVYIDVENVDVYRDELIANGLDVAEAEDRFYGMREIVISDPDGYVLIFGHSIGGDES